MSSEITPLPFQKVPRCYRTQPGWRLATLKEARDNLDMIKEHKLLEDCERARLLNGWISGPRHNFQMGDGYRGAMGDMLLIETSQNSMLGKELYADVSLDRAGKEMALLLCSEDWNYEVVYWVLNSLAETEAAKMDASDVRGGNIPFSTTLFLELNKMVNDFARTLGDSPASEKAVNEKFSPHSIKKFLLRMWSCCWNKLDESYKKRFGRLSEEDRIAWNARKISRDLASLDWLPEFASQGDVSDAIKNFTWEYLSSIIIAMCAHLSLDLLIKEWLKFRSQPLTTAQKNFLVSTRILFYLSYYYADRFEFENVRNILNEAKGKLVGGDVEHFKRKLQDGSYWHVYDTENYSALDKVLHVSASGSDFIISKKMLDYGAQPLSKLQKTTVLHLAVRCWRASEDEVNDFAKRLFAKCNAKEQLANAVDDDQWTTLHMASWRGFARTCELLLRYGGKPDAQDKQGRIPLHAAVIMEKDAVVDVLVRRGKNDEAQSQDAPDINQNRVDLVNFKDREGMSPLDLAVEENNMKVVANLLAISEQPLEDYFDIVDSGRLLRQFALEGNTDIVRKLLKSKAKPDDVDEEGKTTLHYIAMSEYRYRAVKIYNLIREGIPKREIKNLIAMCDSYGRTAIHLAAKTGNDRLCNFLLDGNWEIRNIKDQDGQSPVHYAVKGNHDNRKVIEVLWRGLDDSLVDLTGLTPLHVAATAGKIYLADKLLSYSDDPKSYVKKLDFLGQTALHKACEKGHIDTIKVLLHWGAEPLLERDCDGRTALHYAVQTETEKRMTIVQLLLKRLKRFKSEEKKLLFLWASAAGLGTADENLEEDSPLKNLLQKEKKDFLQNLKNQGKETNLTRIAASIGDIEMTKELLTRGGQIADIEDQAWIKRLQGETQDKDNVEKVLKQIQSIAEQANDQPTMDDNLGRSDFACGLAALLLNPYLKPPINVGISGNWGKGKSSLMRQTEIILLKTTAQLALLSSSQLSTLDFHGAKKLEPSIKGKSRRKKIQRKIELLKNYEKFKGDSFLSRMKIKLEGNPIVMESLLVTESLLSPLMKKIQRWKGAREELSAKDEDPLFLFLDNYEDKYHNVFKSLAAMDASYLFKKPHDSPMEESVPAIITVQYNAWKYRNDKEALAGMAVEITREMERTMTLPQWMSTSWRNTWEKQKQDIWMKVIFPCILAVFLAGTFTCIVWLLLDRYKFKTSTELKYASLPVTVLITVWTLVKAVMSTVNPVSTQLLNYIKFPNHADNLGYQEKVISDIKFLKGEIGRKPFLLCTIAAYIWDLVNAFCTLSFLSLESFGEVKVFNACVNPRIIVFVDDLDRCHESVILQVLSTINLVLAVCEINVIVGMDKALIGRAIIKKFGDKNLKGEELADQYLQKIIQLPLDLPDPDHGQSKKFLERQLGVFQNQRMDKNQNEKSKVDVSHHEKDDEDYKALFSDKSKVDAYDLESEDEDIPLDPIESFSYIDTSSVSAMNEILCRETSTPGTNISEEPKVERPGETNASENKDVVIPMDGDKVVDSFEGEGIAGKDPSKIDTGDQKSSKIRKFFNLINPYLGFVTRKIFCRETSIPGTSISEESKVERPGETNARENKDVSMDVSGEQRSSKIIPIKKMLFIRYSEGERNAFYYFQSLVTGYRKLPREWKRLLNYHRLVWNIFSMSEEAKQLAAWQVQLITWIFICWEWQENMNFLIEEWNTIDILKTSNRYEPPSLKMIVADVIKNKRWLSKENMSMNSHEEGAMKQNQDVKKQNDPKGNMSMNYNKEEANKILVSENKEMCANKGISSKKLEDAMKEQEGAEEQGDLADDMFKNAVKEIKELKEKAMEDIKEVKEKVMEEIKELKDKFKEIELELKDQGTRTKQKGQKSEKSEETNKIREKNWNRLKSTLDRYNVSMDGIQAFQRFRFYCNARHLQWTLPSEDS